MVWVVNQREPAWADRGEVFQLGWDKSRTWIAGRSWVVVSEALRRCVGVLCEQRACVMNRWWLCVDAGAPAAAKPVLGLYLIGWGLGSILCGIVAAINSLEHYDNQE